ncbi:hypothetical protein Tco_0412194 [Tanacetum coccineum]
MSPQDHSSMVYMLDNPDPLLDQGRVDLFEKQEITIPIGVRVGEDIATIGFKYGVEFPLDGMDISKNKNFLETVGLVFSTGATTGATMGSRTGVVIGSGPTGGWTGAVLCEQEGELGPLSPRGVVSDPVVEAELGAEAEAWFILSKSMLRTNIPVGRNISGKQLRVGRVLLHTYLGNNALSSCLTNLGRALDEGFLNTREAFCHIRFHCCEFNES